MCGKEKVVGPHIHHLQLVTWRVKNYVIVCGPSIAPVRKRKHSM